MIYRSLRGTVKKLGHGLDTDIIIPARYLTLPVEDMKYHAMEPVLPGFADAVRNGNIIVAGRNFGCGSSREQAVAVLKELGIAAIVAISFARIFFRNAINLGVPVIECELVYESVSEGDRIEVDPGDGGIRTLVDGRSFQGSKLPDFLLEIVRDGGLIPHLRRKRQ